MAKTANATPTIEPKRPHLAAAGNTERVERAELRTAEAEARTERAVTRTEMAETRTEQAETRAEQAQTRTEKAETRAEQAETRTEAAETALERVIEKDLAADEKSSQQGSLKHGAKLAEENIVSDKLTSRQREILTLIAQGQNTKTIAATLALSPKTVEYHRMKLMDAIDVHDVAGLVRFAIASGLIEVTGGEGKVT